MVTMDNIVSTDTVYNNGNNRLPSFASLFGDITKPLELHKKLLALDTIIHPYLLKFKKSVNDETFDASTNPFFQPSLSEYINYDECVNYDEFVNYDECVNYDIAASGSVIKGRDSKYADFFNIINVYNKVHFNRALLLLYIYTGSVEKQITTDNGWTLFSLKQIYQRYVDNINSDGAKGTFSGGGGGGGGDSDGGGNGGSLWIDIGLVYRGLGHVLTLRMDIRNGELFMQPDGGSNGWEREEYYNKYINQVPDKSMYKSITTVLDILVNNFEYDG
jgi:hypothetical protein